jgi:hypothetical protein
MRFTNAFRISDVITPSGDRIVQQMLEPLLMIITMILPEFSFLQYIPIHYQSKKTTGPRGQTGDNVRSKANLEGLADDRLLRGWDEPVADREGMKALTGEEEQ